MRCTCPKVSMFNAVNLDCFFHGWRMVNQIHCQNINKEDPNAVTSGPLLTKRKCHLDNMHIKSLPNKKTHCNMQNSPNWIRALAFVSAETGVSVDDVLSKSRRSDIVYARHMTWFVIRTAHELGLSNYTYPMMSRFFGRHHSSIIGGVKKFSERACSERMETAGDIVQRVWNFGGAI